VHRWCRPLHLPSRVADDRPVRVSLRAVAALASLSAGATVAAALATGAAGAARPAVAPGTGAATGVYRPPVAPFRVIRPFQPPPTPYAAGHRGVDLATHVGQEVLAAGAGSVRFSGPVAGRGVVVIAHPDGVLTEYEPVRPAVVPGAVVRIGQVIGHVLGQHGAWPAGACLHWGARRDGRYFDPLSLLRALGVVRLVPLHGPVPGLADFASGARAPPPSSSAGMGLVVGLAQPFHRDVRVELGGGEAGVAE
jgi:murein DD-endopeptidase MepM/ murein hydrolase activator NlpD